MGVRGRGRTDHVQTVNNRSHFYIVAGHAFPIFLSVFSLCMPAFCIMFACLVYYFHEKRCCLSKKRYSDNESGVCQNQIRNGHASQADVDIAVGENRGSSP